MPLAQLLRRGAFIRAEVEGLRASLDVRFSRGVLERPVEAPPLTPEAEAALVAHYEEMHRGTGRTGRLAVLQEGTTFKPVSLSPADAQLL